MTSSSLLTKEGLVERLRNRRRSLTVFATLLVLYTLAGFFLLPWLIKSNSIEMLEETYGAELTIEKLAINPYVLSVNVEGLTLNDPAGEHFFSVQQVFVNFQLSSIFRRAFTFKEISIVAPSLSLERAAEGDLNAMFLAAAPADAADAPVVEEESGLPRFIVFEFAVIDSMVTWQDNLPVTPISTALGPASIRISDLSTLPTREGLQQVVIATETQGTLSWQGSLQLSPLRSAGTASIAGSHFPLLSEYIRHDTGIEITDGDLKLDLNYLVDLSNDGQLAAVIDSIDIEVRDTRLRTYDPDGDGSEFLHLPFIELRGGEVRWPEQTASVGLISIDDADLRVARDADGKISIIRETTSEPRPLEANGEGDGASQEPGADPADTSPWSVSLDEFRIQRAAVGWLDESVSPAAGLGMKSINLSLTEISNQENAQIPSRLSMETMSGGVIEADGNLVLLPTPVADFSYALQRIRLDLMQPYIRQAFDVSLDSGELAVSGGFYHGPDNVLRLTGDLAIEDFLVTETDEGSRLGAWDRLGVNAISLDLEQQSLEISQIRLDKPFADIFIAEDGSVNLGRVGKDDVPNAQDSGEAASPSDVSEDADALSVAVGEVLIVDGSASFVDESLPLPFAAQIAELAGNMTTIATNSSEPSTVSFDGKVDEFGQVKVSGTITPLDPIRDTSISVAFENVDVPKFSAYSVPFAGREIASGRLDLTLGYELDEGALVGENSVVLREFELGDKVPHPGAASLPLGLAVALLKDSSGNIDIDLPVRGDVNDPEFSYGAVIGKAFVNLVVKIAASPFALLGGLVGLEPDELEYIEFAAGESRLAPPQQERAAKLAEALSLRPELILELPPVLAAAEDSAALREEQLDIRIRERISEEGAGDTDARREVVEQLFRESSGADDVKEQLKLLESEFTRVDDAVPDSDAVFDVAAYTAELRRRLIDREVLAEDALLALADARATTTRDAVTAIDASLAERIRIVDVNSSPDIEEQSILMRVALSVSD